MTNSFILLVLFSEIMWFFGGEIGSHLKSLCLQGFDPGEDTYQVSGILSGFVIGNGISFWEASLLYKSLQSYFKATWSLTFDSFETRSL